MIKVLDSFAGRATLAVGATALLYTSLTKLSDAYNLSYDSAIKNTSAELNNFNNTKSQIDNLQTQTNSYKDTLSELAKTYKITIEPNDSANKLITKLKSTDLSAVDNHTVQKIKLANDELERQTAIKEKLSEQQQQLSASNARDTLNRGPPSVAQQVAQNVPGGKRTYQGLVDNVNVVDAVNENISSIEQYEKAIEDLKKNQTGFNPGSADWKNAEKDINSYRSAIGALSLDLETKQVDLTTLLSGFSKNGEDVIAQNGYHNEFKAVKNALNSICRQPDHIYCRCKRS